MAVTSGSAERAGLRTDDTIRAAGRTPTPDPPALAAVLAAAHPGDQLTFSVTRGTQDLSAKLTLTELAAA